MGLMWAAVLLGCAFFIARGFYYIGFMDGVERRRER